MSGTHQKQIGLEEATGQIQLAHWWFGVVNWRLGGSHNPLQELNPNPNHQSKPLILGVTGQVDFLNYALEIRHFFDVAHPDPLGFTQTLALSVDMLSMSLSISMVPFIGWFNGTPKEHHQKMANLGVSLRKLFTPRFPQDFVHF